MPQVVGVLIKPVTRLKYCDPNGLELPVGSRVLIETVQGLLFGLVVMPQFEALAEDLEENIPRAVRIATQSDLDKIKSNIDAAKRGIPICKQKISEHKLPMKIVNAEYNFDGTTVTFFFTSDNRVDFRELVKDVARVLKCRIMFYQIGARDQAKTMGGVGICGLSLCCNSFLSEFNSISMRMAKEQDLFLNPVKFSGVCGKLLCCLAYEHEVYKEARTRLPAIGEPVKTPRGQGVVTGINVVQYSITAQLEETSALASFPAQECEWEARHPAVTLIGHSGKPRHCGFTKRAYKEEDEDNQEDEIIE